MVRGAGALAPFLLFALASCATPSRAPVAIRVVGEHHEAVAVLLAARVAGTLREPVTLVHLDAHPDLGTPDLDTSLDRAPGETPAGHAARVGPHLEAMNVDEVLVPATLLGLIDAVVWVVPDWLDESPRDETCEVGSSGGLGRDLVRGDHLDEVTHPDRRPLAIRVRRLDGVEPPRAPWVLGIDLDFLDCRNPHAGHVDRPVDEAAARDLLARGRIVDRGRTEDAGTLVESTLLRLLGEALPRRVDRIEAGGHVRWVAGWQCMGEEVDLPVHAATPGEVRDVLRRLEARLRAWTAPALVIVARSRGSGFAGPGVDEDEVLRTLRRVYGDG